MIKGNRKSAVLDAVKNHIREHGDSTILDIVRDAKLVNGIPVWKKIKSTHSLSMRMLKDKRFYVVDYDSNPVRDLNGWKSGGRYAIWGIRND